METKTGPRKRSERGKDTDVEAETVNFRNTGSRGAEMKTAHGAEVLSSPFSETWLGLFASSKELQCL